jgi:hypothetical protein
MTNANLKLALILSGVRIEWLHLWAAPSDRIATEPFYLKLDSELFGAIYHQPDEPKPWRANYWQRDYLSPIVHLGNFATQNAATAALERHVFERALELPPSA